MAKIGVPQPEFSKNNLNGGVIPKIIGGFVFKLLPLTLNFSHYLNSCP